MTRGGEEALGRPPYLSHSQVNRYSHCPEQYRLYYLEGLRPRFPSANLVFGQVLHQAIAQSLKDGSDGQDTFHNLWGAASGLELSYSRADSWEKLRDTGHTLLGQFAKERKARIGPVRAIEQSFTLHLPDLELPFFGIVDLDADVDGEATVLDFKTAGSRYEGFEAQLADQLSAYQLAIPGAKKTGLCVLVKAKQPRIEWFLTPRDPKGLTAYLTKIGIVAREIALGHFYKRPGLWCSWCDFLPVCLGDEAKQAATLTRRSA